MASLRFGRVQLRIMQVIWEKGRVNARDITEAMNKISPIAHSTVQTLLRKLEQKGAVDHDIDDRTFIFYPLVDAEKATRSAFLEFVERFFAGSTEGLASYLIKSKDISPDELRKIRKMLDEKEK
ncbi:MAG: BlaI/MecI/CopY family transcriptional regulator [Candidatus Latescibacteria bacterium]|jgi:BlaI family transcriptional regulator, penicillinase repressor|nr:BlaI/MecI/CopY family transcriptional regulator [Candidatus Latescibacterota bacterium]